MTDENPSTRMTIGKAFVGGLEAAALFGVAAAVIVGVGVVASGTALTALALLNLAKVVGIAASIGFTFGFSQDLIGMLSDRTADATARAYQGLRRRFIHPGGPKQ